MIMKFLLFNALVIGALFYLFNADKSDIASVADTAHAVVARAENVAADAVDKVDGFMHRDTEVEAVAPKYTAAPTLPPVAEPPVLAPKKVVAETKAAPKPPAIPPVKESGNLDSKRSRIAEQNLPEEWVPQLSRPTVDYAKAEKTVPISDPAVVKRRAEVLGEAPAPSETPSKSSDGEITIAEGETLMTPRERRKELFALAEEMELMFLKKLSR